MRENSRRVLRLLRRDPLDRHRPERTAVSFLASVLVHALIALFLFSVATSSSEQAPESFPGGVVMTVTSQSVPSAAPATPLPKVAAAVPHAPVVPKARAVTQPRSAPPHPRVLHELSKFAPTAPPNPTPAPESSLAPNPVPTQAVIAVSPAPLPIAVPTSVPTAAVIAASIKVPPTTAPVPKPSVVPTQAPRTPQPQPSLAPTSPPSATPLPEPTAIAVTAAPIAAMATPVPVTTPGSMGPIKIAEQPKQQHGTAATPGPKPVGSPGPRGVAPVKTQAAPKPIQAPPATPRPAPVHVTGKHKPTLSQRLQSLIPTAGPSFTPATPSARYNIGNIVPTPVPEPTPPPEVLAATKYLYVENVAGQRWKQSWLGTAPEEHYVKMYVTSVKRVGFINWCTGWVLRSPLAGSKKWIIEPNESFICGGHLEPFTPPSPSATSSP